MHNPRSRYVDEPDYFVYRTATGTGRPPSLSLLPGLEFPTKPESFVPASYLDYAVRRPSLVSGGTGLLRRGEHGILVVHVELWYDCDAGCRMAMFCVLCPGMSRWELLQPVPLSRCGCYSSIRTIICVSDGFLCCIWYGSAFLLCDMADEAASPKVRSVGLPLEVRRCSYAYNDNLERFQRMGVVAGGDSSSVRIISIHPNCCRSVDPDHDLYSNDKRHCCCIEGTAECWHPRFVFTIKTWTMNNLNMDEPLEWVEDAAIDGEEIWALPGYEGLPQAIPEWPVVCLDKQNVVCFVVSNYHFTKDGEKKWMVQLNITTKTVLSVVQLNSDDGFWTEDYSYHMPAELQY